MENVLPVTSPEVGHLPIGHLEADAEPHESRTERKRSGYCIERHGEVREHPCCKGSRPQAEPTVLHGEHAEGHRPVGPADNRGHVHSADEADVGLGHAPIMPGQTDS
jgi:hypothetical protein